MQARFARDHVDVLTNSRVKEVRDDKVVFTQMEDGKPVLKEIPMGFCLWSTGVGKLIQPPLVCLIKSLSLL